MMTMMIGQAVSDAFAAYHLFPEQQSGDVASLECFDPDPRACEPAELLARLCWCYET